MKWTDKQRDDPDLPTLKGEVDLDLDLMPAHVQAALAKNSQADGGGRPRPLTGLIQGMT